MDYPLDLSIRKGRYEGFTKDQADYRVPSSQKSGIKVSKPEVIVSLKKAEVDCYKRGPSSTYKRGPSSTYKSIDSTTYQHSLLQPGSDYMLHQQTSYLAFPYLLNQNYYSLYATSGLSVENQDLSGGLFQAVLHHDVTPFSKRPYEKALSPTATGVHQFEISPESCYSHREWPLYECSTFSNTHAYRCYQPVPNSECLYEASDKSQCGEQCVLSKSRYMNQSDHQSVMKTPKGNYKKNLKNFNSSTLSNVSDLHGKQNEGYTSLKKGHGLKQNPASTTICKSQTLTDISKSPCDSFTFEVASHQPFSSIRHGETMPENKTELLTKDLNNNVEEEKEFSDLKEEPDDVMYESNLGQSGHSVQTGISSLREEQCGNRTQEIDCNNNLPQCFDEKKWQSHINTSDNTNQWVNLKDFTHNQFTNKEIQYTAHSQSCMKIEKAQNISQSLKKRDIIGDLKQVKESMITDTNQMQSIMKDSVPHRNQQLRNRVVTSERRSVINKVDPSHSLDHQINVQSKDDDRWNETVSNLAIGGMSSRNTIDQELLTYREKDYTEVVSEEGNGDLRVSSPDDMQPCQAFYWCHVCEKSLKTEIEANKHRKSHSVKTEANLHWYYLQVYGVVTTHWKGFNHDDRCVYLCGLCDSAMLYTLGFSQHILNHGKGHKCPVCSKVLQSRKEYLQHRSSDCGRKVFICMKCNQKCSSKHHLYQHQKMHSRVATSGSFNCMYCHKKLASRGSLNTHTRLHTGLNPYMCRICKKSYPQNVQLKLHLKTHKGK